MIGKPSDPPPFFTPAALSERWGISTGQVFEFVNAGELGFVHLGSGEPKKRSKGRKLIGFTLAQVLEFETRRSKIWADESKAPRLPEIEEDRHGLMGPRKTRGKR